MWAPRYFTKRYWAGRFWPKVVVAAPSDVTVALSGTSSPVLLGRMTATVDDTRLLMGRYRAGRRERQ